ncbi:MAG: hypothetical protein VW891_04350, partial [Novosphingobium sp.]
LSGSCLESCPVATEQQDIVAARGPHQCQGSTKLARRANDYGSRFQQVGSVLDGVIDLLVTQRTAIAFY